jgi:ATP-dependent DNA helicase RecG
MRYRGCESSTLTFRKELPPYNQIIKTVVGFCNQHGGKLIIGVAEGGQLVGIPDQEAFTAVETVGKAIYEATTPSIFPSVHTQLVGGKTLLIIEVSAGTRKPYYHKSEGLDQGTYIRFGPTTFRANADLLEELKWQSRGKTHDLLPVYDAREKDLNEKAIQRFIEATEKEQQEPIIPTTQALLRSYYLITSEQTQTFATVAGILLFGKTPQYFFPEAFIICSHFKGTEGREALAWIDCTGTLFEQFHTALHFVVSRISRSSTIQGMPREETLKVPESAIREALLNAIVHRNYHIPSSIKIFIYDDRIEFFSPGTLAGPLDLQNLKMGVKCIRNIAIWKAFREANYFEKKMDCGFATIFQSYEKQERRLKTPTLIEAENYVQCILPRICAENSGLLRHDLSVKHDLAAQALK